MYLFKCIIRKVPQSITLKENPKIVSRSKNHIIAYDRTPKNPYPEKYSRRIGMRHAQRSDIYNLFINQRNQRIGQHTGNHITRKRKNPRLRIFLRLSPIITQNIFERHSFLHICSIPKKLNFSPHLTHTHRQHHQTSIPHRTRGIKYPHANDYSPRQKEKIAPPKNPLLRLPHPHHLSNSLFLYSFTPLPFYLPSKSATLSYTVV